MSQQAKGEWERAFAVCQKVSQTDSSDGPVGVARLTRQESVVVPPNSEMVLWTQLYGAETKSDFCALVEGPERDDEWQVARTVAWVVKGRLPIRVCNPNPYPVTMPQRRPLANVFQVEPSQIRGEKDLLLKTSDPGVVEVDVQTQELWEKYHQASGHMGIAKIDALLRKTFYWRGPCGPTRAEKCITPTKVSETKQG
ncbi:hypothetical protein F7725_004180 [Dissostichus mawsoni]|uniref:Integrase zinc-binding domain-containing protein n=1 Tax=Dissostichus mawsoni TaxID=36200 RepID=A0A7J5XHY9_DISMA|nr:hypothetical protein F7725_004180 [Dissostichus mawsoni]